MTTREEYYELMNKYPDLTAIGFLGKVNPYTGISHEELFDRTREELRQAYAEFQACIDWIEHHPNYPRYRADLQWADEVQEWLAALGRPMHIGVGSVVLAAEYEGFFIRRFRNKLYCVIAGKEWGENDK
jgi:hypothetical protein